MKCPAFTPIALKTSRHTTPGGIVPSTHHSHSGWPPLRSPSVSLLSLLLTLSLTQGMLWCWSIFGPSVEQASPPHALTWLGAKLYSPDDDMLIFGIGVIVCVLLDAMLRLWLARSVPKDTGPSTSPSLLIACCTVVLIPTLSLERRTAFLSAFVIGMAWVAWHLRAPRRLHYGAPAWPAPVTEDTPPRIGLARALMAPLAIIALFVFVPWPEAVVWPSFASDRFHHFDFYAMAPALAHAHGLRLGTDFYAQYGVGWPVVLHGLGATTGLASYTTFAQLEVLVGCAYFFALFLFLRAWLREAEHATVGLLLVLLLALFTNTGGYAKWLWPSSTVMRYAFDITLFSVLLVHSRSNAAWLGPLAGAALALQCLFSTDVGLYLLLAFAVYLICELRCRGSERPARSMRWFCLGTLLGFGALAGAGFTLANQGHFPDRSFWTGWMESILAYGGGIANLPIAHSLARSPTNSLLLLAMLTTYILCLSKCLVGLIRGGLSEDASLRGAIATYGLGTLILFIGRSHEQNLMHVSIPFCLLVTQATAPMVRASTRYLPKAHGLLSVALVAMIWIQADKVHYPNLANALLGPVVLTQSTPIKTEEVPSANPDVKTEFMAASDAIRTAADQGRHSVAVIGYHDTAYLVQAGVAPYFRYSPVLANLLFQGQVKEITRRIEDSPPDWIFIAVDQERTLHGASTADSVRQILTSMAPLYARQDPAGHFQVYRKKVQ